MPDWYYTTGGRQAGPVPREELERLARDGRLRPETPVWTSGMGDWQRAGDQPWFPGSAPPPPPPVPPQSGPRPGGLPSEVRTWAMAAHLSAFVGFIAGVLVLSFVGPLVVWLVKREEHPFIESHAREALNFNLSVLLYGVVCLLLVVVLVGFLLLLALFVAWVALSIQGAVRASQGEPHRYPLTIRFVRG